MSDDITRIPPMLFRVVGMQNQWTDPLTKLWVWLIVEPANGSNRSAKMTTGCKKTRK